MEHRDRAVEELPQEPIDVPFDPNEPKKPKGGSAPSVCEELSEPIVGHEQLVPLGALR
jgi:hypothetical protein